MESFEGVTRRKRSLTQHRHLDAPAAGGHGDPRTHRRPATHVDHRRGSPGYTAAFFRRDPPPAPCEEQGRDHDHSLWLGLNGGCAARAGRRRWLRSASTKPGRGGGGRGPVRPGSTFAAAIYRHDRPPSCGWEPEQRRGGDVPGAADVLHVYSCHGPRSVCPCHRHAAPGSAPRGERWPVSSDA